MLREEIAGCQFPPTRWSLVKSAGEPEALEELVTIYWRPVYHFLRFTGHSPEDAEDLTQTFFTDLSREGGLARAKAEQGQLRSFLLGALKRHLSTVKRDAGRLKRGGAAVHLPLAMSEEDLRQAEMIYAAHPVDEMSPDRVFEQNWVIELLERAHQRLRKDYEGSGKALEYDLLKSAIMTNGKINHGEVSRKLKVKDASIRVLIHRLKRNFRAAFKEEIAQTVNSRAEVEGEYQRLLSVFS